MRLLATIRYLLEPRMGRMLGIWSLFKGPLPWLIVFGLFVIMWIATVNEVNLGYDTRSVSIMRKLFSGISDSPSCSSERQNFVFVKSMKCATETLASVLRRFGYERNLSFVLPVDDGLWIGWPRSPTVQDYRPSNKPFNILTEHAIYNRTFFNSIMPKDTVYISIIREPYSRFVSTFHYFDLQFYSGMGLSVRDPISEYLRNFTAYESRYKDWRTAESREHCPPAGFSVTKNLMSYSLGLPVRLLEDFDDSASVVDYLEKLDQEFLLVLLAEHFLESMVLLKRLMCWTFEDIMYINQNIGSVDLGMEDDRILKQNVDLYKKYSSVDFVLYDFFNKSFWRKVQNQLQFNEELAVFMDIRDKILSFCSDKHLTADCNLKVDDSQWSPGFMVTQRECEIMSQPLLPLLKARYNREEANLQPNKGLKVDQSIC